MFAIALLIQTVCVSVPVPELNVAALSGITVIVPVGVSKAPQPPVSETVYVNEPETVGTPLMVTILEAQVPVSPAGRPLTVAPVAPAVL
jgi:hypothetical protein